VSTAEAEREGTRWQVDARLVEELAAGRTYRQAAEAAGCSLATVTRRMEDRAFRARIREAQDEARKERAQRVRAWQQAGEASLALGLAQLVQVLNDRGTAPAVKVAAVRVLWQQFAPREPLVLLEVAAEPATVEELFALPEGTDEADVIDFGRALYSQLTGRGDGGAADALARRHRQQEPKAATDAAPEPEPDPEPQAEATTEPEAAADVAPEVEPDPPTPPAIPLPRGPEAAPRWSDGLATRPHHHRPHRRGRWSGDWPRSSWNGRRRFGGSSPTARLASVDQEGGESNARQAGARTSGRWRWREGVLVQLDPGREQGPAAGSGGGGEGQGPERPEGPRLEEVTGCGTRPLERR